jgi:hypothetical protein|uniref:Uncharacterized protein n=1 Tax=Picea sitchensis TaxID=3332 RepID=A9NVI6_PICSI|nr:unknown [Picea sitchensis]
MAPVAGLVAPRTLDAHNAFLRDESKHSVNGICANKQVAVSHNGVDANKQLISQSSQQQQHPGQEYLSRTATVTQQVVDGRREKDLNDSLLSGRGGNRTPSAITEQEQELNGRRKVRWNDSHGNELVEVWEFQPSDTSDSDDEEDDDSQACTCVIM